MFFEPTAIHHDSTVRIVKLRGESGRSILILILSSASALIEELSYLLLRCAADKEIMIR